MILDFSLICEQNWQSFEQSKVTHFTKFDSLLMYKILCVGKIKEKFLKDLKLNRKQDIEKGHTSLGIQRDDIYFFINTKKIDIYGSQGQQRTSILSLKLAELEIIKEEIGENPILLLDDFMSELDKKRIQGLFENIKENQVIITCTDSFKINNSKYKLYKVTNATVECI